MMKMFWLFCIVLISAQPILGDECSNIKSDCATCIQNINCKWCTEPKAGESNCVSILEENSCLIDYENPMPTINIPNNQDPNGQLTPEKVQMKLRKGIAKKFKAKFWQKKDFPLDLYFLIDSSRSMKDHIETISRIAPELTASLDELTSEIKIGFGTFMDKVILPYTDPGQSYKTPPFSYRNDLPLTEDTKIFRTLMERAKDKVSTNVDSPEGGFDALLQVMSCEDKINWRSRGEVRRVVVFVTDARFHQAGDGKLAGVVIPHDGGCYLDGNGSYTHYDQFDYPSVGHLNALAKKSKVNIVFAVSNYIKTYEKLSNEIYGSSARQLKQNSVNMVDIVREEYEKITSAVEFDDKNDDENSYIQINYRSNCLDKTAPMKDTKYCDKIRVDDRVEFEISVTLIKCPEKPLDGPIEVNITAGVEVIRLFIEPQCNCLCENDPIDYSTADQCQGNGYIKCGRCSCKENFYGQDCKCEENASYNPETKSDLKSCISNNQTEEICSGKGECECGICNCNSNKIEGTLCECDMRPCYDFTGCNSIEKCDNKECSGHGTCNCGKCICHNGYTGKKCKCPGERSCKLRETDEVCSGRGTCDCGVCICDTKDNTVYSGQFCEECPTCDVGRCSLYRDCVQCDVYGSGEYRGELCEKNCSHIKELITLTDYDSNLIHEWINNFGAVPCKFTEDSTGCEFNFTYRYNRHDKSYEINAHRQKSCPPEPNVLRYVSGLIAAIVAIGLLTLIIWKVVATVQDQKEYKAFIKRQQAEASVIQSPMYLPPDTETANPTFNPNIK